MSEHIQHGAENDPKPHDDCGCGCAGAGDCNETADAPQKARRALMVGAGSAAFVATLFNRRAFAQTGAECGPVSHAASLNHSHQTQTTNCGGLSPGFWKNHAACVTNLIGDFTKVTLGSKLSNLSSIDATSAGTTFQAALCASNSDASHWACAILDALSPGMNPSYGYTISTLNSAILKAHNASVSASNILAALETLENDFDTNNGGCANSSIC